MNNLIAVKPCSDNCRLNLLSPNLKAQIRIKNSTASSSAKHGTTELTPGLKLQISEDRFHEQQSQVTENSTASASAKHGITELTPGLKLQILEDRFHEQQPQITEKHFREWFIGSGVSDEIIWRNVISLEAPKEIARRLGWKAYRHTPGWWVSGIDPQSGDQRQWGQFKPDTPLQLPDEEKPAKYLTPKGDYEAIFLDTGDPDYWPSILEDPSELIVLTEGAKKAGAGLSIGLPTIALAGVWMGQLSKRKLIPDLDLIAVPGRPIALAFDADILVKPEVQQALIHLANLLKRRGCIVVIVSWDIVQGKGMDDFIQGNGADEFKDLVYDAVPYKEWLKGLEQQFSSSNKAKEPGKQSSKIPAFDCVGSQIAEDYLGKLIFNNSSRIWLQYELENNGTWTPITDEWMEKIVYDILEAKGIQELPSHTYVTNIIKKMRSKLSVREWLEVSPKDYLPFRNGALEVATGKLLPHSPTYYFTWCLPRDYNPLATDWEPINQWLDEVTGNNQSIKKILLCWLNAVLKGRSDLQRFLHITGPGGSGKGTFTRLCTALIGERNICSSNLDNWNSNRFESANAYRKRLVMFPDEDKYSGGLGRFKSLTGGDYIRGEEKGKKAFQFIYDGMVMVASNYPIFAGDNSSGMNRRCLVVPFNNQPSLRRDLDKEFAPYLSALTNYVLGIADAEVTETLLHEQPPEVIEQTWEYRMRTDSVAAWLNECCIRDSNALEAVGNNKDDAATLFGSYYQYCQRSGSKAKGSREFSPSLLDLCNHSLKWGDISKVVRNNGKFIRGLRLRSDADIGIPNPIEALSAPVTGGVTGGIRHGDGWSDGSQSALRKESDGSDGSNQISLRVETSLEISNLIGNSPSNKKDIAFHPSLPSLPSLSSPGEGLSGDGKMPVTDATRHSTSESDEARPLTAGDRVEIVMANSKYQGQAGTVQRVLQETALTSYRVQPDRSSQVIDYQRSDLKLLV